MTRDSIFVACRVTRYALRIARHAFDRARAVRLPDVVERLSADGLVPVGGSPEDLHAQIRKEIAQWREVVMRAKIKLE